MDRVPFEPSMGAEVASWPVDAAECLAWCSAESVSAETVVGWAGGDDVEAWVLVDEGRVAAYGEIWIDDDEQEVELADLIVPHDRRGGGVGRRLVDGLWACAADYHPTVVMRVRPDNVAAQRCYAAAGFERVSDRDEAAWNVHQPVPYVWMHRHHQHA